MEDDHLVHIPKEDYISRKKFNQQLFMAFAIPIIIAIFTAGILYNKLNATERKVEGKADKETVEIQLEYIRKDVDRVSKNQERLEKKVDEGMGEIIDILKDKYGG